MCVFGVLLPPFFLGQAKRKRKRQIYLLIAILSSSFFFVSSFSPFAPHSVTIPLCIAMAKRRKSKGNDHQICMNVKKTHVGIMQPWMGKSWKPTPPPPTQKKREKRKKKGRHTAISITRDYRHTLSFKSDLIQVRIREWGPTFTAYRAYPTKMNGRTSIVYFLFHLF